jgi:hypothetical protein
MKTGGPKKVRCAIYTRVSTDQGGTCRAISCFVFWPIGFRPSVPASARWTDQPLS